MFSGNKFDLKPLPDEKDWPLFYVYEDNNIYRGVTLHLTHNKFKTLCKLTIKTGWAYTATEELPYCKNCLYQQELNKNKDG